ncbi:MAG: DUF4276 family protein [Lautropia sp.]|nr:DUF4276 family protein [Lautropia sp.]
MIRIHLLVEGQTEEAFVKELLVPHYASQNIFLEAIIVRTSQGHKGGVVRYAKIRPQILRLCKQDRHAYVSTLFDLYALPPDFPGKSDDAYKQQKSGAQKARFLEQALAEDIDQPRFLPNLLVHEFEALLFTDLNAFKLWTNDDTQIDSLIQNTGGQAPEDINDGPDTAPSKRILHVMPAYQKALHGPLVAIDIGLDRIRQACPHFDAWLKRIEQIPARTTLR